jgi:hypothetical protein
MAFIKEIFDMFQQFELCPEYIWNKLQEPARSGSKPADYLLLLSALDGGWKIVESSQIISVTPVRSISYLITLFHSQRRQARQLLVAALPELAPLLKNVDMTIINRCDAPLA